MILADKIIKLRKQRGWSQEQLAEKMNVSRQAVSKWESDQAVPDIDKIIMLSQLFGVTTDYLLKDDFQSEDKVSEGETVTPSRLVGLLEAKKYLEERRTASKKTALATFLCILSPIPLIVLGGASELRSGMISSNFAGAAGMVALFIIVAIACVAFVQCGMSDSAWKFLTDGDFTLENDAEGFVRKKRDEFRPQYNRYNVIGTCICVLSPIPLFIGAFFDIDMLSVLMLAATMIIAGIGVMFFIIADMQWSSMKKLIREDDSEFSGDRSKKKKLESSVSSIYWSLATAVYLAWSFLTNDWGRTWIVWPIAGVAFSVVRTVINLIVEGKKDK